MISTQTPEGATLTVRTSFVYSRMAHHERETVTFFRDNGSLHSVGYLEGHRCVGEWRGYYENGQQQYATYEGGFLCWCSAESRVKDHWSPEGYHEVIDGYGTAYYHAGDDLLYVIPYAEGRRHGTMQEFHNGKLIYETPYVDGLEHGIARAWDPDGSIWQLEQLVNGVKHGKSFYWEDGKLRAVGNWIRGKHTPLHEWDEQGRRTLRDGTGVCDHGGEVYYYLQGECMWMDAWPHSRRFLPKWLKEPTTRFK